MKKKMKLYTTREFADLFRVSPITVDSWEKRGLVRPYGREVSGRKLFSHRQYLDILDLGADPGRICWIGEAAAMLGTDVDALRRMIRRGEIPFRRAKTGHVFFIESQIPKAGDGTGESGVLVSPAKAAHSLGISINALRIWDKVGKFKGSRTVDGKLAYSPGQMRRLARMLGSLAA